MLRLNDYRCDKCGKVFEALANQGEAVACQRCGQTTQRLFPLFRVNMGPVPIGGHWDDNLQAFVRSNNHRRELMLQQGVSERGATPKEGQAWV